jgi:hypothetical protein
MLTVNILTVTSYKKRWKWAPRACKQSSAHFIFLATTRTRSVYCPNKTRDSFLKMAETTGIVFVD